MLCTLQYFEDLAECDIRRTSVIHFCRHSSRSRKVRNDLIRFHGIFADYTYNIVKGNSKQATKPCAKLTSTEQSKRSYWSTHLLWSINDIGLVPRLLCGPGNEVTRESLPCSVSTLIYYMNPTIEIRVRNLSWTNTWEGALVHKPTITLVNHHIIIVLGQTLEREH